MTSVLNVDTIADKAGTGPVALTKQQAAKHFVNYDAPNQTSDSSFNQSSVTDYAEGEFKSNFSSSFSSASNKVHITSTMNSSNDGGAIVAARTLGGTNSGVGTLANNQAIEALSSSGVQFFTTKGSNGSTDGAQVDLSASYVVSMGDLA
jgi:hypothetical protein